MKYVIRGAKILEIPDILSITKACAADMIKKGIYQWNKYYPNYAVFENDIKRDELFVLEKDGKIIGTVVVSAIMDKEYANITWLTPNENNCYVHRLAVVPQRQGQGYAQKLMDFAENYALKNRFVSIRLDTFSQNKRNQKFYEARGYQKLGNVFFPKQSEHPFHCYELLL